MTDDRPNPDELLAQVQAEEQRAKRGRLKIFFGCAPGVGKTYAMLEAARKEAKEGLDVVIGYLEPHARPETQALSLGLDVLERRPVAYSGTTLWEFDLERALLRKPQILVVDELAHTNAPGSTHAKRYQDVEDLLEAGINVYTTVNVQHLESLNDVVARITGVVVRETIPDSIFDAADEIELVDLSPEDLVERLREGKVYVPQQAQRAIENFFRPGNLIALRELSLRRAAERVGQQVVAYRQSAAVNVMWPTSERLLVCIGASPSSANLIRATRRLAATLRAPWLAAYVASPKSPPLSPADSQRLAANLQLAEQLGAESISLAGTDPFEELVSFAHQRNVTKIIVGKTQQPRWREFLFGSFVYELTRRTGDIDLWVISGEEERHARTDTTAPPSRLPIEEYVFAILVVAMSTGVGLLMRPHFAAANIVMVYLVGVMLTAIRCRLGPSALAACLAVAAFDFFCVPPYGTFAVSDTQYFVTFGIMLAAGLVMSSLAARARQHAAFAREREHHTASLYALSRELTTLRTPHEIAVSSARHIAEAFGCRVAVLLKNSGERLNEISLPSHSYTVTDRDRGVAQWVLSHQEKAGRGLQTLPGADAMYLPLSGISETLGVLGILPSPESVLYAPDKLRLLETFAGQVAVALERCDLQHEAETTRIQIEAERLRNSLLSTVSHDLRTPLAGIAGSASTLLESKSLPEDTHRELLESIYDESEMLNRLVGNLLDATRLDSGAVVLHKEWHSIEELVGAVLNRLERLLTRHPVHTHLAPELPLIQVDGVLLQQLLVNLLENAAKFSPFDTPIDLNARADQHELVLEVADAGPGITPGDEQRIFERFYHAPQDGQRAGVGLGLTICRAIVELHGGKIQAENRPGGGAMFRVTLPMTAEPPVVHAEASTHEVA